MPTPSTPRVIFRGKKVSPRGAQGGNLLPWTGTAGPARLWIHGHSCPKRAGRDEGQPADGPASCSSEVPGAQDAGSEVERLVRTQTGALAVCTVVTCEPRLRLRNEKEAGSSPCFAHLQAV